MLVYCVCWLDSLWKFFVLFFCLFTAKVSVEKKQFTEDKLRGLLSPQTKFVLDEHNDMYKFASNRSTSLNCSDLRTDIISTRQLVILTSRSWKSESHILLLRMKYKRSLSFPGCPCCLLYLCANLSSIVPSHRTLFARRRKTTEQLRGLSSSPHPSQRSSGCIAFLSAYSIVGVALSLCLSWHYKSEHSGTQERGRAHHRRGYRPAKRIRSPARLQVGQKGRLAPLPAGCAADYTCAARAWLIVWIAIAQNRNLLSLRDLTGVHLPFLLNLKNRCLAAIRSRFSVPASQIRAFVHYQPTFYHFHVHFAHISFLPSGGGVASGRGTILRLFSLVLAFFFLFVESSLTFFLQLYCWMI